MSVLMACYNGAAFLAESVASVQAQTYRNFEVIVCDDGSTDETQQVLGALASGDQRIKWLSKENGGMASAWNTCWEAATGEIICLLDADDVFSPNKLAFIVEKVRSGFGLVIHPMIMVDSKRKVLGAVPAFSSLDEGWLADSLVRRGGRWRFQPTSALSFPRELGQLIFPMPEAPFRMNADAFIYTLLPLVAPVGVIPEVLSEYRVHDDNAIAGKRPTTEFFNRSIQFHRTLLEEVNKRLKAVWNVAIILEPDRNIIFSQQSLMRDLLSGGVPRRQLIKSFLTFCHLTVKDDLDSRSRKLVDIFGLGAAIIMPPSRRSGWLWNVYGQGLGKRLACTLVKSWRPHTVLRRAPTPIGNGIAGSGERIGTTSSRSGRR